MYTLVVEAHSIIITKAKKIRFNAAVILTETYNWMNLYGQSATSTGRAYWT